jgi:15-cis-phytoene synthase
MPGRASEADPVRLGARPVLARRPPPATEMARAGPGVTLEDSYALCARLNRRHGSTYYWSTYALPRIKRHHVHALYGFCRYADDIVDELGPTPADVRAKALSDLGERFFADLARGSSDDPILRAVVHTARAFAIDPGCFRRFLASMTMDLTVTSYETWRDLCGYMDGSAAVIGEMMLPILEPLDERAERHARDLGDAFQLTNFLRDVGEDLDRGRIYLPQEDLRRFGADPRSRRVTPAWVELMRFEIARCRRLYISADIGIGMLPSGSARCVRVARVLYSRILDVIERRGYDVFSGRARVPAWEKLALGALAASPLA